MLRWLLIVPLLLLVVLFALSNTTPVALRLWPFDLAWEVSLALAVLIVGAAFFVLGGLIVWLGGMSARAQARRDRHTLTMAELELERIRARQEAEAHPGLVTPNRLTSPAA